MSEVVGIRGRGLIGGSFEKAFVRAGHEVLDLKTASAAEIGRCSLVVVCLPPLLVAPWIREHAGDFAPGTIVTDAAFSRDAILQSGPKGFFSAAKKVVFLKER